MKQVIYNNLYNKQIDMKHVIYNTHYTAMKQVICNNLYNNETSDI